MSDSSVLATHRHIHRKRIKKEIAEDGIDAIVLGALNRYDSDGRKKVVRNMFIALAVCLLVVVTSSIFFIRTINQMHETYIRETEKVIVTRSQIDLANQWERMPVNQRKENLRTQFFAVVRYYTNLVPPEQKMSDDGILAAFNQLWICTERLPHINFFFPVAYMKIKTNFNPVYNIDYQRGIVGFYLKTAETVANLPLVKSDQVFMTSYKGTATLNNPIEAIRLLVARIDDLMQTFNNREDWVLLALFTDEYNVISQYWKDGEGEIPDKFYKEGQLADTLKYYQSFKNWQIPMTVEAKQ